MQIFRLRAEKCDIFMQNVLEGGTQDVIIIMKNITEHSDVQFTVSES